MKQQLAASLGAVEASSGAGGQVPSAPAANAAPPDAHVPEQPSGQQQQKGSSLSPPAAAAECAAEREDQPPQGQAVQDMSADDAISTVDSTAMATSAEGTQQTGHTNDGAAAETLATEEDLATTGARGSEGGQMVGEGKADDHRHSQDRAERTQPASLAQPTPEVVVEEKIVERVVVEEKVRVVSRAIL